MSLQLSGSDPSQQNVKKRMEVVPYQNDYEQGVLELFRTFSPDHPELADIKNFRWQKCMRYIAILGERVIGHIAQLPGTMYVKHTPCEVGWGATLIVSNENPVLQTFSGTKLLDQVTTKSALPFAAVGVVPEIEASHRRRGYHINRMHLRMYSRLLRPSRALKFMKMPTLLALPINVLNLIFRGKNSNSSTLKSVSRFEPEWDSLWLAILMEQNTNFTARTAEYLNYKISQPDKQYKCFLHLDRNGRPDGYIVYRVGRHRTKNLELLRVCDLVGGSEAKSDLLYHAVNNGKKSGVDGIVALASCQDAGLYRAAGMWVGRPYTIVLPWELTGRTQVTFFDSDLDNLW